MVHDSWAKIAVIHRFSSDLAGKKSPTSKKSYCLSRFERVARGLLLP
jgi:hypothetical protein